ncbi:transglutaminase-like cysteine peptidase [Uliginosibacterium sp. 31-16]|uniref:transglutaminase-like cysteine peptidase n=1 Tax=Uliginosibacterium sp. 31-16 TaxID=3068315 RepID=UPI00273F2242|nr:transglutaminase-like cysteine peptidase [Uliginosibacterium sp. 31-16]MDP5240149.1 transglutaminase-like cysteine peptidase [Uliginosibacterium sp. 31-16]
MRFRLWKIKDMRWRSVALMLLLGVSLAGAAVAPERMLQAITARFGDRGAQGFRDWREMLAQTAALPEAEKLRRVNEFFGRHMRFLPDASVWRQVDYWATPLESLGQGAGDCEDFVIAKYFSLIELGVDRSKLRWIYVVATIGVPGSGVTEPHMVLGYYATPGAEPLVLDNLTTSILPASRRPDLAPVFSFNSDGIWKQGAATASGSVNQLSLWRELMRKMKEEGYEP